MVIAALITFGMLLAAWILAPSGGHARRSAVVAAEPSVIEASVRSAATS